MKNLNMKNNKFLVRIFLFMPGLFLLGCSDFLSTEPDSTRATLNTPEQVSQLLTTAYPQGGYVAFSEAMSDNADDKGVGRMIALIGVLIAMKSWMHNLILKIHQTCTGQKRTKPFQQQILLCRLLVKRRILLFFLHKRGKHWLPELMRILCWLAFFQSFTIRQQPPQIREYLM